MRLLTSWGTRKPKKPSAEEIAAKVKAKVLEESPVFSSIQDWDTEQWRGVYNLGKCSVCGQRRLWHGSPRFARIDDRPSRSHLIPYGGEG